MAFKSILMKSACVAATLFSITTNANALQYNVGIGYGIGLFEFNGSREDSTFQGNIQAIQTGPLNTVGAPAAMRTTYKYVGNLPQRILHLEAGATKNFENIRLMDRNLFAGAVFGFGWGKTTNAEGLLNPNGNYSNTGSTALFWSLNAKFGLENSGSKIYGIAGLTYAKADLPYDILPYGFYQGSTDILTCTTLQAGSVLLESGLVNQGSIPAIITAGQAACNNIQVSDASYSTWFINLGAGTEVNITKKLTIFAEYSHMFQLNKNATHNVDYTVNGQAGTFTGVIKTTNVDYIKAGIRYYFN
jgi:opacity protein-like surface antigen